MRSLLVDVTFAPSARAHDDIVKNGVLADQLTGVSGFEWNENPAAAEIYSVAGP